MKKYITAYRKYLKRHPALRYVLLSFKWGFLVTFFVVSILIAIGFISGELDEILVDYDIKYNSGIFIALRWILVGVAAASLLYGILSLLIKYIRSGYRIKSLLDGFHSDNYYYPKGNSYRELKKCLIEKGINGNEKN